MATYEDAVAMNASQGYIGGYGPSSTRGRGTDPNMFKSHPNFQTTSQQLPSYHSMGRPDEKAALNSAGESASYDNLPSPGETAFEKSNGPVTFNDEQAPHASGSGPQGHGGDRDRGLMDFKIMDYRVMDFFYKKPDPNYAGTYGTDYEPQISKTRVALAAAAVATVAYGFSKFKQDRREEQNRRFEKYTRSGNERRSRRRSQGMGHSQYDYESAYDGQHKY
ncbi:hypothetical protein LPJ72_001931 [Coemansia sp. Benny D160-2]|nr:hypothetical protein LPJ72_001931 [Coemansia sp. Benny D160-2]